MENWFMLTMFGKDRPGIVAKLSAALCQAGCNLGDSSMARLGNNFSIMVMIQTPGTDAELEEQVRAIGSDLALTHHLDPVAGELEHHIQPDVRISIYTRDRPGVVEDVSTLLSEAGLNILHLDSNVGSEPDRANYYIHIEGITSQGLDPLYRALDRLNQEKGMNTQLIPINL